MKNYIYQLPSGEQAEQLNRAIQGRGAFRQFRNLIEHFGMLDQWYEFQNQSYHDEVIAGVKRIILNMELI